MNCSYEYAPSNNSAPAPQGVRKTTPKPEFSQLQKTSENLFSIKPFINTSTADHSDNSSSEMLEKALAMRSHKCATLLWIETGNISITISGSTSTYSHNTLIYIPENTMYGYISSKNSSGFIIHTPKDLARNLPETPQKIKLLTLSQLAQISSILHNFYRESKSDNMSKHRALRLQAELFFLWVERQISDTPDCEILHHTEHLIAAAYTALVEENFHRTHHISQYAANLGITSTHLTRICNKSSGRPASAILADRIHHEAKELLKNSELKVHEISKALGFTSPAYFSRAFSKLAGESPSYFRKKSRLNTRSIYAAFAT